MGTQNHLRWNTLSALVLLAGCGGAARLPVATGFGPTPELPAPSGSLIPLVHVAPATGWKSGVMPTPAAGLAVNAFATGLDHPRWLYLLPNGDVLVAETNAPSKPDDSKGIRGWFMNKLMKKAGAETPSANRITLLRDADGDGVAELQTHFLIGLHSPFGMALIDSTLYVANSDAVRRFRYHRGDTVINSPGEKVLDLPAGSINHHWTKNILASEDHKKLYITIGSNSNAAENGMAVEAGRAEIMEYDIATGATRVFASGLRNANGMSWQPESHALWTSVNERDEIGSDLVPDYMTSVQDGGFYGWPYSYYGQHLDTRVKPQRPDLVARAIVPDYALGAHTASLSMVFYDDSLFPHSFWGGAFVGQHGSWNRKPFSGYQVLFVPFTHGKPSGAMQPILTAFVDSTGHARGRPVGVAVDSHGALLVADDVGNVVWRVRPDRPQM